MYFYFLTKNIASAIFATFSRQKIKINSPVLRNLRLRVGWLHTQASSLVRSPAPSSPKEAHETNGGHACVSVVGFGRRDGHHPIRPKNHVRALRVRTFLYDTKGEIFWIQFSGVSDPPRAFRTKSSNFRKPIFFSRKMVYKRRNGVELKIWSKFHVFFLEKSHL